MARLIPNIDVDEIDLKPERDVARALVDQLPNNVLVLHSYPWLRPDRNDRTGKVTLIEGEADFLIVWPEMGILVVEIKGGTIKYDADNRGWFRELGSYSKPIKDPFEQARRNSHQIVGLVSNRVYGGNSPPFSHGYAVIFPDCIYSGALPPGADAAITLSSNDLSSIADKVARALRQWARTATPYAFSKEELGKVQRAILPAFNILPVLFRTIEEQEERLIRLTDEQIRLLAFLGDNRRVAIEGVAGSGKTMLAKRQAETFAEKGLKTLFVCFNKELANWLKQELPGELDDLVHVHHFHALCAQLCRRAGISFNPPERNSEHFWKEEAAYLLLDALEFIQEQYDAVVVDEAQDFYPDWWEPLEQLNEAKENGFLYVFYDPAQNLYNDGKVFVPAMGEPFRLPTNCRNTKAISGTCSKILKREIATHPLAPEGVSTEFITEKKHKIPPAIDSMVKQWIAVDKISCSQVVILSPNRFKNSCLNGLNKIGEQKLTFDTSEWRHGEGILFSTIRSFKGLEADIVILVDVVEPGSVEHFGNSDLYVACSRAKHILKIVSDRKIEDLIV